MQKTPIVIIHLHFRLLHWYPGEPNNFVKGAEPENCAEIVPAWNYQWNDRYCSKEQLYICKKNRELTDYYKPFPNADAF